MLKLGKPKCPLTAEWINKLWHTYTRHGEGNGTPLQYFCLENPMDRGAWWATVHGVAKSRKRLSDVTFTFHFHALEKEMATHSSVLAWRIPGMGEPVGLLSMGLHWVGHDWSDLVVVVYKAILLRSKKGTNSWCNNMDETQMHMPSDRNQIEKKLQDVFINGILEK